MRELRHGALRVPLPDGWDDRTTLTLAGPEQSDGLAPTLIVLRERVPPATAPTALADGHLEVLCQTAPGAAVLHSETARIDGCDAVVRVVRFQVGDAPPLVQLQAFFVRDEVGHAIVGTAGAEGFAAAEPCFREVIEGLRRAAEATAA